MNDRTDSQLLHAYTEHRSEPAFAELVRRHVDFVYSAARRMVRDSHLAEDVTQGVFVALAKNPGPLAERPVLTGWLHRTAQNIAAQTVRTEVRRRAREQEAAAMNELLAHESDAAWEDIAPHLDAALGELSEADRDALLLRYFERKSAQEMAQTLGVSEEAAQKRVSRAVERLREFFVKRGIAVGASGLVAVISANAVQAAPAGLSTAIVGAAFAGTSGAAAATTAATKAFSLGAGKIAALVAALALVVAVPAYLQHRAGESQRAELAVQDQPVLSDAAASPNSSAVTASPGVVSPSGVRPAELEAGAAREPFSTKALFTLSSPPGAVVVQPDGRVIIAATVGGWFVDEFSGTLGWYNRGAMRFEADGSLDRSFYCDVGRPEATAAFMSHLSLSPDGRVLMSGLFNAVEGKPRPGYALLKPDGSLDHDFQPWRGSNAIPGRTFLPGGTFPAVRLEDGSVAVMCPSVEGRRTSHGLTAYRFDAEGNWLRPTNLTVGGTFSRPSGLIATLNGNGFSTRQTIAWTNAAPAKPRPPVRYGYDMVELADSPAVQDIPFGQWTESPSAAEATVVLKSLFEEVPFEMCCYALRLPDGGALFAVRDGPPLGPSRLMRFDKDWRPDFSFTNEFQSHISSRITLRRQPDGKILVAGIVGQMNGENFSGVMRLEPDGRIDYSFHCDIANEVGTRVMDMALQPEGRIVICGYFTEVNRTPVQHLARLNPDGSLDRTFKPPFLAHE